MEALKKLKLVQLISMGKVRSPLSCFHCVTYADIEQTSPLPKYTHPLLIRLFKNTVYHAFINAYPQSTELLHEIYDKERQTFSTVNPSRSSLPHLTHPVTGEKLGLDQPSRRPCASLGVEEADSHLRHPSPRGHWQSNQDRFRG